MAKSDSTEFASAFDGLLEKSRRGWDSLVPNSGRGLSAPAAPAVPAQPQASARGGPAPAPAGNLARSGEYEAARRVWDPAKSEAAAALTRRFGPGWRIEFAERRREGDEFVVAVTLTVPDKGIAVTRPGRGKIPAPSTDPAVQGTAGGVAFSISGKPAGETNLQSPEERGYRRAIEHGLAQCAQAL